MEILIVDDSVSMRKIVKEFLQEEGYGVHEAGSSQEAYMQIAKQSLDLVLMDFLLPGTNGAELIREIRSLRQYDKLPVIVITTENDEECMEVCREAGANALLFKPFSKESLLSAIRNQLT